jgi:acyl-CoA synthetase (AMP-forming)/AMP-acid ligase II
MAFITLHPQHAIQWGNRHREFEQDLKNHARARLPGFACPEWVAIVEELPVSLYSFASFRGWVNFQLTIEFQKTSTGKILKTDLRKIAAKL